MRAGVILNCITLLVSDHVPVDSQRDAWVRVPQFAFRTTAGVAPSAGKVLHLRTVAHAVETTAFYAAVVIGPGA